MTKNDKSGEVKVNTPIKGSTVRNIILSSNKAFEKAQGKSLPGRVCRESSPLFRENDFGQVQQKVRPLNI